MPHPGPDRGVMLPVVRRFVTSSTDHAGLRRPRPTRRILAGAVVVLVLAGCGFLAGFMQFAAGLQGTEHRPVRHADALVVLTGGSDRVSDAIDLLAEGRADRLLITGVNPATSPDELVKRLPRLRSLVDCCVTFGYGALDTAGNAAETAAWVRAYDIRSLIVVTSNYHMPRALAEIGHTLRGVDLVAYPVVSAPARGRPWWTSPHRIRLIASEYVKYVVVLLRQALLPPPRPPEPDTLITARAGP